jgi:hypothetical protein
MRWATYDRLIERLAATDRLLDVRLLWAVKQLGPR